MSTVNIFAGRGCALSGKIIKHRLIALGHDARLIRSHEALSTPWRSEINLYWGFSGSVRFRPSLSEIGCRDTLTRYTDKYQALRQFRDCGVPIPRFGPLPLATDRNSLPPLVYARTGYHASGSGLELCETREQVMALPPEFTHWIEAITVPRTEYRIHLFDNGVIHRQRKFFNGDPDPHQDAVRNYRNGWRFSSIDLANGSVITAAKKAIRALGYRWGAVDILLTDDPQKVYVLEVNSAPSIDFEDTQNAYISRFHGLIDSASSRVSAPEAGYFDEDEEDPNLHDSDCDCSYCYEQREEF